MNKIVLAAVLASTMSAASAQVYLGGSLGQSHANFDCADTVSCDKSDVGYKLTLGYKLNPVVALEASYVDFGKANAVVPDSGLLVNVDVKSSGLLFAAAFRHQATPVLGLVGRLGLSSLETKATASVLGASASRTYSSTKPYVGLGIEYALNKQVSLTAGADFTRVEVDGESSAVRLLGVGLRYDF